MKRFVKLTTMLLAGVMAVSLAACGGSKDDATKDSAAATKADAAVGSEAAAPAGGEALSFSKPDDLKGHKLAAQRGTVGEGLAKDLVGEDNVVTFEKYVDAVTALEQKKVDGVIMDQRPAERFVKERQGLVIMAEPMSVESYAIALKKGNTELQKQLDDCLKKMKEDGSLTKIIDKYNSDVDVKPEDIDLNKGAAGGKLVMGTEAGFAPYELKVGDGYIGVDIEIMAHIAKMLDKELVIENMNFDSLPAAVNSGKIDCAVAGITVTDDRKENMDFTVPYVEDARQVALVRAADYKGEPATAPAAEAAPAGSSAPAETTAK